MITDIDNFIRQFHGQRRRTQWVVDALPEEKANWRPWPGEPSPSEIICRIGAGHLMYTTAIAHNYWAIDDYEIVAEKGWTAAVEYFQTTTESAIEILRQQPNSVLEAKRRRPDDDNIPVSAWRYLIAMFDHEISHRAQLSSYLMLLNVRRPQMGGVSIEAVRKSLSEKNH